MSSSGRVILLCYSLMPESQAPLLVNMIDWIDYSTNTIYFAWSNLDTYSSSFPLSFTKWRRKQAPSSITHQSKWDTANTSAGSSNSDQVKLPLVEWGVYDFTVDWGDGSADRITAYDDPAVTHTYSATGQYTIKIFGLCQGLAFKNTGDKLKLLEINSWGSVEFSNDAFYGCTNLTVLPDSGYPLAASNSFKQWFRGTTGLNNKDLIAAVRFDTSCIGNLEAMFYGNTTFNQPLNNWDVGNVVSARSMFYNACAFNQPLDNWDIKNIRDMSNIFQGSGLSDTNYATTVKAWATQGGWAYQNWNKNGQLKSGVSLHGGSASLSSDAEAQDARNFLEDSANGYSWTITDGDG